jgi:putative ABC transport system permease protein
MSIIWRKVWRDLWNNKLRTILVVLSTAAGVFALGLVFGSSGVMRERMTASHQESHSPHLEFYTSRFDEDVVEAIRREPGVSETEGETRMSFQWKRVGEDDWRDGTVIARGDYDEQLMYPIDLLEGAWPDKRELAIERMSSPHYDLPIGATVVVKVEDREYRLPITGIARHPYTPPPQINMGNATFVGSLETVAWMIGQDEGFDTLNVRLDAFSQEAAEEAADRIQDRLRAMDIEVGYWDIVEPDVHWAQEMLDAIFLILGVLGGLSLGLSGFLIINTMNAIITQQIWQIGVMKVVGASAGRVIRLYLTTALIYGLLSLFVSVPLGAAGAYLLSAWMLDLFNILVGSFRVAPGPVIVQVAIGLIVPLLTALVPVIGGARISPHQAISSYGLGGSFGRGLLDRLIGSIRRLPRPMALSLRNTFRRKARVALTLLALTIGGVMFIMVLSVGASFQNTIDVLLNDFGFDVFVVFERAYRVSRLVEIANSVPGVTSAEIWDIRTATMERATGEEIQGQLWGVPDGSKLFNPRIVNGRSLLPDDGRAILVNNKIAVDEGIQVGDLVTLTVDNRELTWTVVGTIINLNNDQRDNFVPYDTLAHEVGNINRSAVVMLMTEKHDAESHSQMIEDLRSAYTAGRIKTTYFQSAGELREQIGSQFDVIVNLMLAMAILAAIVGSMGLMGTMSINVVERGREIGVMRAIGATSLAVVGIFVGEGMLVGLLSGLLAIPVSYPGALAFSSVVGKQLIELPLDFSYPASGVMLWMVIVLVLSALASLWPALRAARVSVRESLAYE